MPDPRPRTHRRSPLITALVAIGLVLPIRSVLAQHAIPELEDQLSRVRTRLGTADLAPDQRMSLLRQCDDLERRLIAGAPSDDRLASWLADRAACALDLAGEDGADAAVLFGVPTANQKRIVRTRAKEAMELIQRAERAAAQSIASLEAQLVDRRNPEQAKREAASIEAKLHTLVDVEQAERIPQIRAVARLLAGITSTEPSERDQIQIAAKELGAIGGQAAESPESRRVYLGVALAHAASAYPERSEEYAAAASAQLSPIAGAFRATAGATENGSAIRARLALLRTGKDLGARAPLLNGTQESDLRMLEAEARAAGLFDRAQRESGARAILLGSAVKLLIESVASEGHEDNEQSRVRIYDKIASAIPAGTALDRLPPEAAFAMAISRARQNAPGAPPDPLVRDDALSLLDAVIARSDSSDSLRLQARWERAVIVAAAGDGPREIDALNAYVVAAPKTDERTIQAARRIVDLFSRQQAVGPLPDAWQAKTPALRDALALLLKSDPSSADRWRQETARLCIADLSRDQAPESLDRALDALESLPAGTEGDASAKPLGEAVLVALEKARSAAAARSDAQGPSKARGAWEIITPRAARALAWSQAREPSKAPVLSLLLGEARVGMDDPRAVESLSTLAAGAFEQPSSPYWSRYRIVLARAQRLASQDGAALTTLRDLADRLEGEPGTAARDPAYWAAWAETLEIMQSQNADKSRSADIRVQAKRLELLDAKLGGPPYAERIRKVRAAVGE
jgi:hypothetical protein